MKLKLTFLAFILTALNINAYSCECPEKPLVNVIVYTNSIFIGKILYFVNLNAQVKYSKSLLEDIGLPYDEETRRIVTALNS